MYPPSGGSKTKQSTETLYSLIQQIKKILPAIVVKGIPTVNRAIIHKVRLVEGRGFCQGGWVRAFRQVLVGTLPGFSWHSGRLNSPIMSTLLLCLSGIVCFTLHFDDF